MKWRQMMKDNTSQSTQFFFNHIILWFCSLFLIFISPSISFAQTYPDRNIVGVVPFPPGGGTDIFGRLVAENLSKQLGQTVIVENKAGADGNIGMDFVAKSNPNGYTLLFNSSAATVNPVLYSKLRFDPLKDLTPIGIACEYYNVIVINPEKTSSKSLAEFLDLIRKNPGKINAGAGGTRLVIDMFTSTGKLDVAVIPYKGGGDSITALLKGEVDFIIINTPGIIQFLNSGKLKVSIKFQGKLLINLLNKLAFLIIFVKLLSYSIQSNSSAVATGLSGSQLGYLPQEFRNKVR
jgi:tripartite-type tricarboxylate transporter receptor subunit TctC